MRRLDGITDSMDMGLGGFRQLVTDREAWRAAVIILGVNAQRRKKEVPEFLLFLLIPRGCS